MSFLVMSLVPLGLLGICGCYEPDTATYTLTIQTSGNGKTSSETAEYDEGENVVIIATPDDGWEFDSWSGDDSSKNERLLVVMNKDKTVTANFVKEDCTLTVSTQGQGSVSPSSGTYKYGDQITLTATAADGWQFSGWSGSVTSASNPILFTMDSNETIYAVFTQPDDQYTLTVTSTGSGTVTPATGDHDYGSLIELKAAANADWHFVHWSGNTSGIDTTTYLYLTEDMTATAVFEKDASSYTLTTNSSGKGSVTPNSGSYDSGTVVTLTATADSGYHFVRWTGDIAATNANTTVTMNSTRSVTAVFEAIADKYALSADVVGQGSVTPTAGTYEKSATVSITATPADGWYFVHWLGDVSQSQSTDATISLTMNASKEITAVFNSNPQILLETSKGNITLELNMAKAPKTVANFLTYVQEGFYDGQDGDGATIFHRVISGFMIQGGGLTATLTSKVTHDPIAIESNNGLKNNAYTIAMARTSDPDSATSQFFINLVNNDFLNYQDDDNPGYTVFGKVISGTAVVDAIGAVATQSSGDYDDVPVDTITITKVSLITP
jgi:cyclophilin family peptidyl-prolyl cis-trans isomerase